MIRDLFSAAHLFTEKSAKGDTSSQMAAKMPKVLYINILGYTLRKANPEMVQPFKVMYTKPPEEVAIPNFGGYNIQLPKVLDMKQDFSNELYCWCYTLYTAHTERKTVREVISMTPALQAYAQRDAGFQQFSDRHAAVSADPQTRRDYVSWFNDMLREDGIHEAGRQQGYEEGYEGGYEEAEEKHKNEMLSAARILKSAGVSIEVIASAYPLSKEEIENL